MAELQMVDLYKSFGNTSVLNGISFTVKDGEFLSLLGPSGCGKSTLLRIINGLEYADTGSILLSGKDISNISVENRNIGMVFQNYALFPHMTVFNNIAYGLKLRKFKKQVIKEKVFDVLKLVKLEDMHNRKINQMSGGQQQRVALARALVIEPSILLLDEPLSALDKNIRSDMQYEIRNIQEKIGITTIFVTHDQEEAMIMSDKIVLMNKGKIEQLDDPEVMYNQPKSLFASDFLGKANILEGTMLIKDGNKFVGGTGWHLPVHEKTDLPNGTKVNVAVRGEHFQLSTEPVKDWAAATIQKKVFQGTVCKIFAEVEGSLIEFTCLNIAAENYQAGKKIYFSVPSEKVHCFPIES